MATKPDRPKQPTMRWYVVEYDDGRYVELEAEHRGMARHYAKSFVEDEYMVGSMENYRRVKRAVLRRDQAA